MGIKGLTPFHAKRHFESRMTNNLLEEQQVEQHSREQRRCQSCGLKLYQDRSGRGGGGNSQYKERGSDETGPVANWGTKEVKGHWKMESGRGGGGLEGR